MKGDLYACEACGIVTEGVPTKCVCGGTKFKKLTGKLLRKLL